MAAVATAGSGNWSSTTPNLPWPGGTVPAATDTITIASGHVVTINQDVSAGSDPGFGGTAAIDIVGTLQFDNAASRTLTLSGDLKISSGGKFYSSAALTPITSTYILTVIYNKSASMASGKYGLRVPYSTTSELKMYGTVKTNNTYLTAQALSGQKVIVVNDATGWADGDTIEVAGINAAGASSTNAEERIIAAGGISGLTITLTVNLSVTHPANGYIINTTKNIIFKSNNTTNGFFADTRFGTITNFVLDNVQINTICNPSTAITGCLGFAINGNAASEPSTGNLTSCVFYRHAGAITAGGMLNLYGPIGTEVTVNQCSFFGSAGSTVGILFSAGYLQPVITNSIFMKCGTGASFSGSAGGIEATISGCWFNGCNPAIACSNVGGVSLSNNKFDGNSSVQNFYSGFVMANLTDESSSYGTISPNANVFAIFLNAYMAYISSNPTFGASEVIFLAANPQSNIAPGGSLALNNSTEDVTTGIFRKYLYTGTFLKDLVTQRNSVSSLRYDATFIGTSVYSFTFLAKTGVAYKLLANMQYNAAYDDAAYTLPSITISGLGITPVVATATAAALSAWEKHALNVTQNSGADGLLTVTYSAQSATAAGSAYFDGIVCPPFITSARWYGYNFDVTIPTRTVNSNVVAAEATALAYAGIAIDWTLKTLTVTTAHTMLEIYDYCQAQMAAAANLTKSEFISTTDGLNYTLLPDWDIVIDGVTVTATGVIVVTSATGAWSVINSGDFTGILRDASSSRVHITLAGLVSGSRVRIEKASDNSTIYSDTASGTTVTTSFVWTTNTAINIIVRKSSAATKYLPYNALGTVTNIGFALTVNQISDTIVA